MEEINTAYANLRLSLEENRVVVGSSRTNAQRQRWSLCLAGKILTDKQIIVAAFRSTLKHIWRTEKGFAIREVGERHLSKSCLEGSTSVKDPGTNQFGPWLRAAVEPRIKIAKEDREMETVRITELLKKVEEPHVETYLVETVQEEQPSPEIRQTDVAKEVLESIRPRVDAIMNDLLLVRPTTEKIRTALFQMHPSKVLGPDGTHAIFYQKF
ncbi:hypothetical protein V2J09_018641 [Rumex salicifolius]